MTADEAVQFVRSGDRVWFGEGCGTPQPLIEALVRRSPERRDVELCHMLTFGDAAYCVLLFEDTAPPDIYTLSLHDALPIYLAGSELAFRYHGHIVWLMQLAR